MSKSEKLSFLFFLDFFLDGQKAWLKKMGFTYFQTIRLLTSQLNDGLIGVGWKPPIAAVVIFVAVHQLCQNKIGSSTELELHMEIC